MWKSEGVKSLVLVALVAALAGLMAVPADCQQWQPDNEVMFVITGNGGNQEIRITDRGRGTALCRPSEEARPGCPDQITWTWGNAEAYPEWKLVIEYIKGTPDARLCFEKDRYELERGQGGQARAEATVGPRCPEKSAWIYRVRCELVNGGGQCDGIDDIDPGVVIER